MTDAGHGLASLSTLKSMSGLDFLQAMIDGRLPRAPMGATLNFVPVAVSKGILNDGIVVIQDCVGGTLACPRCEVT